MTRAHRLDWDQRWQSMPELLAIPKESLVLDIGANVGESALAFSKMGFEVITVEAHDDSFEVLSHNVMLPAFGDRVRAIHAAVGNGESIRQYGPAGGNKGGRYVFPDADGERTLRIDDIPRDRRVAFMKMDIEGYEPYALEGAVRLLAEDKPVIAIETNLHALARTGKTEADVLKHLGGYSLREFFRYDDQRDYICVPNG